MKRKMNALIWSLCAVVALGGCAVSKKSDTGNADMVMKDDAGETVDPADTAETFSEAAGSTNTADTSDARDLTTAELQKFTDWINEGDNGGNYGFLLSDYGDPKDADLLFGRGHGHGAVDSRGAAGISEDIRSGRYRDGLCPAYDGTD